MIRLRIDEVAKQRGISLSSLQLRCQLPLSTMRRYWHSSASGTAKDAGSLLMVHLETLDLISDILEVEPGKLLEKQPNCPDVDLEIMQWRVK